MTTMDKVASTTRATMQAVFDKEPVNYLEGGALYGIVSQGRHNRAVLEVMYNHALDPELKSLIKECMDNLVNPTIAQCEELLKEGGAQVPQFRFNERILHDNIDIPGDARLSDEEIAAGMGTMAKASQMALLAALHQTYQLDVGIVFRKFLDAGLDWNYRLIQLMIHRGWLPHLAKISH